MEKNVDAARLRIARFVYVMHYSLGTQAHMIRTRRLHGRKAYVVRANRRVVPIQLVTSGLHEGPQSPTIARWMRIDLNPKNPVVFN